MGNKQDNKTADDDIVLYFLEHCIDFDTKAIAISLGTTSKHAINQRRYRMKNAWVYPINNKV